MSEHGPGGHAHLSHLPDADLPGVYAARAEVAFRPPADAGELEAGIDDFFAELSTRLVTAGCILVGHIKGTLAASGHGDIAFHATALGSPPALSGGFTGLVAEATLVINVIVFGVEERALPTLVQGAWSHAVRATTTWR